MGANIPGNCIVRLTSGGATSKKHTSIGDCIGGLIWMVISGGLRLGRLFPGTYIRGSYNQGLHRKGGGLHPEVYFKGAYISVLYPGGL